MDKVDFPSIYRNFLIEAERLGETELWWESFHNNVACARHIEAAIRNYFDETFERLKPGCAESVLAVWGADRVNMVLANTLQDIPSHLRHLYSGENLDWGGEAQLPPDAAYRRYYVANSSAELVDSFVTQTREMCDVHFDNRKNGKGRWDFESKKFQHDTKEVHMSDYGTKYLAEVSRQLQRAGFTVKPEEDDRLSVEQESQRICRVNTEGAVFYDQDTRAYRGEILQRAIDIARMTSGYMWQMERAPELKAVGLDGGYKLLGEFNDTVLAGRETRYGVNFITWSWNREHTSLTDGHYHMENYTGAKQDFAVRSGAVTREQIFTPEQLAEVYRSIHETLDSEYPITDARKTLLEEASHQIEDVVPDLEQRVSQSNQQELELAQELEGGYEQGQSFAGL